MDDLRAADVDFLTIGQYLQPTKKHHAVERFVPPDEFEMFKRQAMGKGFLLVAASPLTRSSHHAGDDFARLRAARETQANWRQRRAPPRNEGPQRTEDPALHAGADFRTGRRRREIPGVPALVHRRAHPRAADDLDRRDHDRRPDDRLQNGARDVSPAASPSTGRACASTSTIMQGSVQAPARTTGRFSPTRTASARSTSTSSSSSARSCCRS